MFWNNKVYGIVINTLGTFNGWEDYSKEIFNGVTTKDKRQQVIEKLGNPNLMTTDPKYTTEKDEFGIPQYSYSYYTWIKGEYKIYISVANTDQIIDSNKSIIRPSDGVASISIFDNNYDM